jgi:hypothetical protein
VSAEREEKESECEMDGIPETICFAEFSGDRSGIEDLMTHHETRDRLPL